MYDLVGPVFLTEKRTEEEINVVVELRSYTSSTTGSQKTKSQQYVENE